jgi:hypothetical protein
LFCIHLIYSGTGANESGKNHNLMIFIVESFAIAIEFKGKVRYNKFWLLRLSISLSSLLFLLGILLSCLASPVNKDITETTNVVCSIGGWKI